MGCGGFEYGQSELRGKGWKVRGATRTAGNKDTASHRLDWIFLPKQAIARGIVALSGSNGSSQVASIHMHAEHRMHRRRCTWGWVNRRDSLTQSYQVSQIWRGLASSYAPP
jgi:beta-mannanase